LCDLLGEVTFDSPPTDLPHTKEYGTLMPNGHPLYMLEGALWYEAPYSNGRRSQVIIDLGASYTIRGVHFDWNYHNFSGGEITFGVWLYRADMVELVARTNDVVETQDVWKTRQENFSRPNVRYVRVAIYFNNDAANPQHAFLDTILIKGD